MEMLEALSDTDQWAANEAKDVFLIIGSIQDCLQAAIVHTWKLRHVHFMVLISHEYDATDKQTVPRVAKRVQDFANN